MFIHSSPLFSLCCRVRNNNNNNNHSNAKPFQTVADLGGGQGGQSPPRFSQVMNINFYCIYTLTTDDSLAMFSKYLHSCQPAYSTLYYLTQIALTIAVTSVEAERSFSALKRIKTRLRSTMAQSRLSSLAVFLACPLSAKLHRK